MASVSSKRVLHKSCSHFPPIFHIPSHFSIQKLSPVIFQFRQVQTGFTNSDPDFLNPADPLFASKRDFRHFDDPILKAPIIERSNVGMGLLVLNKNGGLDLSGINDLIRRLRDLEVNSTKRLVVLSNQWMNGRGQNLGTGHYDESSSSANDYYDNDLEQTDSTNAIEKDTSENHRSTSLHKFTIYGINVEEYEMLQYAESANIPDAEILKKTLLRHYVECIYLIADYRKHLLTLFNGRVENEGLSLLYFSNLAACTKDTEVAVSVFSDNSNSQKPNLDNDNFLPETNPSLPRAGLSLILATNPALFCNAVLGEQNFPLKGADLVYANVADAFMGHEAIEFLEVTSEKLSFEVSSADCKELILEHALPLPDISNYYGLKQDAVTQAFRGQNLLLADNLSAILERVKSSGKYAITNGSVFSNSSAIFGSSLTPDQKNAIEASIEAFLDHSADKISELLI